MKTDCGNTVTASQDDPRVANARTAERPRIHVEPCVGWRGATAAAVDAERARDNQMRLGNIDAANALFHLAEAYREIAELRAVLAALAGAR